MAKTEKPKLPQLNYEGKLLLLRFCVKKLGRYTGNQISKLKFPVSF